MAKDNKTPPKNAGTNEAPKDEGKGDVGTATATSPSASPTAETIVPQSSAAVNNPAKVAEMNQPRSTRPGKFLHEFEFVDEAALREDGSEVLSAGGLRSQNTMEKVRQRKALQAKIDNAAKRFMQTYQPTDANPTLARSTELVTIRAMKSHHPAPTIGTFSFQDVYNSFLDGMKYVCPRFVADALEEGDNAITLD